jgi:hypothetical protein
MSHHAVKASNTHNFDNKRAMMALKRSPEESLLNFQEK